MQDTARSFAGKQSDQAKFQLYMEATHFAETIENLNDAEYRITQMLDILHNQGRQFRVSQHATWGVTSRHLHESDSCPVVLWSASRHSNFWCLT